MFKKCSKCDRKWLSREEFLSDKDLRLIGYQVHFEELEIGLFLFNHSCQATLGIYAKEFRELYKGPVFSQRATGSEACPQYCLDPNNLSPCKAECECAYIRELMQVIKKYQVE